MISESPSELRRLWPGATSLRSGNRVNSSLGPEKSASIGDADVDILKRLCVDSFT